MGVRSGRRSRVRHRPLLRAAPAAPLSAVRSELRVFQRPLFRLQWRRSFHSFLLDGFFPFLDIPWYSNGQ